MTDLFNEQSLRAEIVKVWGEQGAHALVFDYMAKRLEALEEIRQRVADGWCADTYQRRWVWASVIGPGGCPEPEKVSPEMASLLWPEDTSG